MIGISAYKNNEKLPETKKSMKKTNQNRDWEKTELQNATYIKVSQVLISRFPNSSGNH